MRMISDATAGALSQPVTTPLHLIWVDFSPAVRLSTRSDVSYAGELWSGGQVVAISGLSADGRGAQAATVQVGNLDNAVGTLVLSQGVADRAVMIWAGDESALATGDMELVFSGVVRSADVDERRVSLSLVAQGSRTAMVPRRVIGPASGFNRLLAAGTKITVGKTTYTLERR